MKRAFVLCTFICSCIASALDEAHRQRVSPVQKVVTLLGELETKIKADGEKEQKAYAAFTDWCKGSSADKAYEIKTAKANVEDLAATIAKAASDISASGSKIEELAGTISANEGDLKAATEIRKKESAEFMAAEGELVDVVDTLDRAVNTLERKMKGSALVQAKVDTKDVSQLVKVLSAVVDAAALSLHDKQRLLSLAQGAGAERDEDDEIGAPAPSVYKTHSEGIVDVLEDLREKAESELHEARKQEVNAKHNYELTKQSLEDQIAADKKEMGEAKATAASAQEAKATAEGDLEVTKKDLADAEKALETMTTSCMTAASDHEASVKSLAQELEALAKAKQALTEMTSPAADHTYSFLQVDGGSHQRTGSGLRTGADLANFEVVRLVKQLAMKEKSAALNQLASRIQAVMKYGASTGEDPFAKVKGIITEMIAKLEEEAGQEATHKAYCDKEMGATQAKIDDLTASLDQLTAKVDKKKALSVTLKGEVQELQAELAELARSDAEMHEARREGHAAFVTKKADLEQGLTGVRMALKLLREYYSGDDGAEAFVQQPDVPEYHKKSTGAGQGILGMLEVVESDFGRGLAQAEMDEDSAATEYEKISMMNKLTKATKEQDVKYKTKEAASLDKAVAELASDREGAQTELDAVLEYSKTIRSACVAKPQTYEERKARREAEVAGLKEALEIL
eukprot:CAMPEP_0195059426 /NCGR_PEP_ID=MMETSP0448-20130528/6924_1 /TAXON_ID=66468 /ORGANISM="Heterocapsa triquestra, Strain CCMP 448" /LENGTH=686 /DNA_ID=CAMNT_0040089703 /DNA_START=50 /DNA_END=2106 /DNA_ORIENTATION=+